MRKPISSSFYRMFEARNTAGWRGLPAVLTHHLFVFVLQGEMKFLVEGQTAINIPAGSYIALPKGIHRHALCDVASRSYRLRFAGAFPCESGLAATPFTAISLLTSLLRVSSIPGHLPETLDHLLLAILSELHQPAPAGVHAGETRHIAALHSWLDEALAGTCNVSEGAQRLGVSPDHFTRLFKKQFGMSPKRYVMDQRFHRACEMLTEDDLPVREIAAQLGVADLSLFCLQFRERFGVTPLAFRRGC